ncbi:hypothetical protein B0H14DRAFT_3174474 [Mycena olivaceomarginata]|nr:hypothetical protein B0H14DRAFT_3174474 [Mycena olivaceomarginata]
MFKRTLSALQIRPFSCLESIGPDQRPFSCFFAAKICVQGLQFTYLSAVLIVPRASCRLSVTGISCIVLRLSLASSENAGTKFRYEVTNLTVDSRFSVKNILVEGCPGLGPKQNKGLLVDIQHSTKSNESQFKSVKLGVSTVEQHQSCPRYTELEARIINESSPPSKHVKRNAGVGPVLRPKMGFREKEQLEGGKRFKRKLAISSPIAGAGGEGGREVSSACPEMITRIHNFVVGVPARVHEGQDLDWRRAVSIQEVERKRSRMGKENK